MRAGLRLAVLVGFLTVPALAALLAGCAATPTAPPSIEYREAKVAVAAPCVVDQPDELKSLQLVIPKEQWDALAPGAKAEAVKAQAGERLNYEDRLRASAAGCPHVAAGTPRSGSTGAPESILPAAQLHQ